MVDTIAKKFYDNLAKGKIMGVQCNKCKKWTFPPVSACRECGSRKITWKKISGQGTCYFYSTSILPPKKFQKYSPYAYGDVVLKEGPSFFTMIEGLDPKLNNLETVAKELKSKYACGGTAKEGYIFLQGDHRDTIKDTLTDLGFAEESIELH